MMPISQLKKLRLREAQGFPGLGGACQDSSQGATCEDLGLQKRAASGQ